MWIALSHQKWRKTCFMIRSRPSSQRHLLLSTPVLRLRLDWRILSIRVRSRSLVTILWWDGFCSTKNALASQLPQEPVAEIAYQEVTDIRADMFSDDTVFYFEALRDNYHREELIGFAWGNQGQIYASADISLLTTELFKRFLSSRLLPMILSAVRCCLVT